jgi:hypothetical protein
MEFHIVFECMYMSFSGDSIMYVGFLKERHLHIKNHESTRSYNSAGDC